MAIQESGEMYLETILILSKKKENVHAIDIVKELGYSKPSVSRAMGILKENGFIEVSDNGEITLTRTGLKRAKSIYEKHTVISDLLMMIGVSEKNAVEDACKAEHYISDETFKVLKKFHSQQNK